MTDTLFDADLYGPGTPPRAATRSVAPRVEAHQDPWVLIRDRGGVRPFFHLPQSRVNTGAVATVCGIIGNQITNVGVDQMVRCPGCDVGVQVNQLSML
jgi:hypothetical protein